MEDLKISIGENGEKEISNVLVPNCIYRMGCPEFGKCGHIDGFIKFVKNNGVDISELFDIQTRYDLWNEWFYSKRD
jgi:hypothetical protein